MTKGLQAEKTARATMIGYTQIVFAGAWGVLLFGEVITWWTVAGAVIVLVGMVVLMSSHHTHEVEVEHLPEVEEVRSEGGAGDV
jgi:drug/metabolite transporter (DMT)-like permease